MCNDARAAKQDWKDCGDKEGDPVERAKLHARIVVLGFSDDQSDLWPTPVGRLPGYALHANYIEALLDDRTYQPLRLLWRFAISFAWFCALEVFFWLPGFSTVKALLLAAAVSALVMFMACYIALVNFGLYVGLFPPSLLLIFALVIHNFSESALHKLR